MQPIKKLEKWLSNHCSKDNYLLRSSDLKALFPELSNGAYRTLFSRAASSDVLMRVARGIYMRKGLNYSGLTLFHIAAFMRPECFNYISLETALSDVGVISQIPFSWITVMSSGRSNKINCGEYGTIEFVHTEKKPNNIRDNLVYDDRCNLWRASVKLALRDMKDAHRDMDLVDWEVVDEYI